MLFRAPAFEPICLAMNPLDGTFAENALKHGVAGLAIDRCRIGHAGAGDLAVSQAKNPGRTDRVTSGVYGGGRPQQSVNASGRWPANVLHDGSEEVLAGFPQAGGGFGVSGGSPDGHGKYGKGFPRGDMRVVGYGDTGSAARFFYCAKASRSEREAGCEGMEEKPVEWKEQFGIQTVTAANWGDPNQKQRSEEHTSELQSH